MKLKFKMQKALVQQQTTNSEHHTMLLKEDSALKMEESALHGLAAVAAAVEEADSKGGLLDNKLDISSIKLERDEVLPVSPQDLSTSNSPSPDPSPSFNCNNIIKPKATEPLVSESFETEIPVNYDLERCRAVEEPQHAATTSSCSATLIPLGQKQCPFNIAALNGPQQQQVRVIKDGRFYEGTHTPQLPHNLSQSALLALNGKQDLRVTQISHGSGCGKKHEPSSHGNLVNVITIGNSPMALDTVKMKLGENDTQIFRAPMVSSTTNALNAAGSPPGPTHSGGVVVTVESSNCSMRPPAAPPRMQLAQQQQIHGNMKLNKQCPSSTTQGHHQHPSSSPPGGSSEEPSSSIPDLGEYASLGLGTGYATVTLGATIYGLFCMLITSHGPTVRTLRSGVCVQTEYIRPLG